MRRALTQAVKRLGKRDGIPHVHPHLFRHFAAIAALKNGASQFKVSRCLGHSTVISADGRAPTNACSTRSVDSSPESRHVRYPQVHAELRKQSVRCGRKLVEHLMRAAGFQAK